MFKTALFVIVTIWKQPKCPPSDRWLSKLVPPYVEGFSVVRHGTAEAHGMDLKDTQTHRVHTT